MIDVKLLGSRPLFQSGSCQKKYGMLLVYRIDAANKIGAALPPLRRITDQCRHDSRGFLLSRHAGGKKAANSKHPNRRLTAHSAASLVKKPDRSRGGLPIGSLAATRRHQSGASFFVNSMILSRTAWLIAYSYRFVAPDQTPGIGSGAFSSLIARYELR